jgi:hypothetical protein
MNDSPNLRELFDHEKFAAALDAVADSRHIENQNQLAVAIGISPSTIKRVYAGNGMEFTSLLQILRWSNIDLRKCLKKRPVEMMQVPTCQKCGCTDARACEGGCSWVEDDLCSRCVPANVSGRIGDEE